MFGFIKELAMGVIGPVVGAFNKRTERKMAQDAAKAKIEYAKNEGQTTLALSDQEWEGLSIQSQSGTWKDEYVTVSIVSLFNLIVLGGLMQAFGHPGVLQGVSIAILALNDIGVDVSFLLEATVLAAVGLNVWRRM